MKINSDFAQLKAICRSANQCEIEFSSIAHLLNQDSVSRMCRQHNKRVLIKELIKRIKYSDRFLLGEKILQLRQSMPQKYILYIWYRCILDNGGMLHFEKDTDNVVLSELLIDHNEVCKRYCKKKKDGWTSLRYICGRHSWRELKLPERMMQTIFDDNSGAFMIMKDICAQRLSFSLLRKILLERAFRIFSVLLEQNEIFRIISFDDLCFCCAADLPDDISVPCLTAIEKVFPGRIKNVRDHWGRNLLWYACVNKYTCFIHPFCHLIEILLQYGCDIKNENQLGLPWEFMFQNLTFHQKELLWKKYERQNYFPFFPHLEQPFYALADKSHYPDWYVKAASKKCETVK